MNEHIHGARVLLITRFGVARDAVLDLHSNYFKLTDCTNPLQNSVIPMHNAKCWFLKNDPLA